uniref:NADH-plastoquinone oxidoreductase subunit I n=1 Tax=Helleborus lividus TaxID=171890 RepID=UPI0025A98BFD|nr:NADH-plastoquinone oxidoreductase subunit I [Helleborus lividus]WIW41837.1 NADH-plastoquinone oxidoreductase subunit I [Helleborus lividus]
MVTGFMNYSRQTVRAARYIGQSFIITLSHANRLPVTIQYPYEKLITSERFRGRIHFEFDKCIACEVCVRVCPIDLPVVDWKLETGIRKKRLLNYSIDFGICIFCGNCVEYCPTNCLSLTEEYELSTYDRLFFHFACILYIIYNNKIIDNSNFERNFLIDKRIEKWYSIIPLN